MATYSKDIAIDRVCLAIERGLSKGISTKLIIELVYVQMPYGLSLEDIKILVSAVNALWINEMQLELEL